MTEPERHPERVVEQVVLGKSTYVPLGVALITAIVIGTFLWENKVAQLDLTHSFDVLTSTVQDLAISVDRLRERVDADYVEADRLDHFLQRLQDLNPDLNIPENEW